MGDESLICSPDNIDNELLELLRQDIKKIYQLSGLSAETRISIIEYINDLILTRRIKSEYILQPQERLNIQNAIVEELDLGVSDPLISDVIGFQLDAFADSIAVASNESGQRQVNRTSDPVDMFSGQFTHESEDILINGAGMDFAFRRIYKNQAVYLGPLGTNWDHSYNLWIRENGDLLIRSTGLLSEDIYTKHRKFGEAGFNYWVPPDGHHSIIRQNNRSYILRTPDGEKYIYERDDANPMVHRIHKIEDLFGNYLEFIYKPTDSLLEYVLVNHRDRRVSFDYDTLKHIIRIRDYIGRSWSYTYDDLGDLVSVTLPATDQYPTGLTTFYEYSSSTYSAELQHDLIRIIDPAGRSYLENEYGSVRGNLSFKRVIRQRQGGGESLFEYENVVNEFDHDYNDSEKPSVQVNYVARNGQEIHNVYNKFGNLLLKEEYIIESGRRRLLQWRYRYNRDGALIGMLSPEGTIFQNYYGRDDYLRFYRISDEEVNSNDENLTDQKRMAFNNLLATVRHGKTFHFLLTDFSVIGFWGDFFPDVLAATDPKSAITKFTYEPEYNQILTSSDPRFIERADPRYSESVAYYATLTSHEYTGPSNDPHKFLSRIRYPNLLLPDNTVLSNVTEQFEFEDLTGRLKRQIDRTGVVTEFFYFNSADGLKEGYLKSKVIDVGGLECKNEFEVNDVGIVTAIHHPRSIGAQPGRFITRFTVNALNQIVNTQVSQPFSYQTRSFFDPSGLLEQKERDVFDENGNPVLGGTEVQLFRYDEEKNLVKESIGDKNRSTHLTTKHKYDEAGLRFVTITPNHSKITRRYNSRMQEIAVTRGAGTAQASTSYSKYDGDGRKVSALTARKCKTEYSYDPLGRIDQIIDPNGNITDLTYDKAGNILVERFFEKQPNGKFSLLTRSEYLYDQLDRRTIERLNLFPGPIPVDNINTDHLSFPGPGVLVSTEFYHDQKGRIVKVINAKGQPSTTTYDALDRKKIETDALGNQSEAYYDQHGNVIRRDIFEQIIDLTSGTPLGQEIFSTIYEYDELDRMISLTDSLGNITLNQYDSRNRLVRTTDPLGNVKKYDYDIYGRKVVERFEVTENGLGGGAQLTPIKTIFEYDGNGNLTGHIDGKGNRTQQTFDTLDRRKNVIYADGSILRTEYDADDNIISIYHPNGIVQRFIYDKLGRNVHVDIDRSSLFPGMRVEGENFEEYVYDGKGRTLDEKNDFVHVRKKLDSLGRVWDERIEITSNILSTGSELSIRRKHDELNYIEELTYNSGRVIRYHRDRLNRLIRIENLNKGNPYLGSAVFPNTYDILQVQYWGQRLSQLHFGNDAKIRFSYDRSGNIIQIRNEDNTSSPLLTIQHLYDAMNNMRFRNYVKLGNNSTGQKFKYDSIYRLTKIQDDNSIQVFDPSDFSPFTSPPPDPIPDSQRLINAKIGPLEQNATNPTFEYDFAGNRTRESNVNYVVNPLNQYTQAGTVSFSYDADGNLRSDTNLKYFFDARDILVRVHNSVSNSDVVRFFHDARGRRIAEIRNNMVFILLWDGLNIIEEYGNGSLTLQYVHEGATDRICQMVQGGSEYWYHKDIIGSTMLLTDETGTQRGSYNYDPFGNTIDEVGPFNPIRYAGRRYDADIGMYDFRAREYMPVYGRFIQRDPKGVAGGFNMYEYALNNPLKFVDPLGAEPSAIAKAGYRFLGGAYGAFANFAGFLRFGLDSWKDILGLPLDDAAQQRLDEGSNWFESLYRSIDEGHFTDWMGEGIQQRMDAYEAAEARGEYFEAGKVAGDTMMNTWNTGRGLYSLARGGVAIGSDIRSYGFVNAMKGVGYNIKYWATNWEGLGIRSIPEARSGVFRGSPYPNYESHFATRSISRITYQAERIIRSGDGNNFSNVVLYRNAIGTQMEALRYGNAVQQVVDNMLVKSSSPILSNQIIRGRAFGTNAKGNAIKPDYRLSIGNQTVIDITTLRQAGKVLKYPAGNLIEPYTGTVRYPIGIIRPIPYPSVSSDELGHYLGIGFEY